MAILNYGNQFKYNGEGYLDSKMAPVNSVDELETNVGTLSALYVPGMKVMVLNDEPFGPIEYYLNDDYEWKRVLDLNQLTLSLDKDDIGNDGTEDVHLQLMYNGEIVGDAIDLSVLLQDVEKRIEALENKEDVTPTEDTNTFVEKAEIVTEKEGENGIFIKFTYNNGETFYTDITELQPKSYAQGLGVLIGEDNIINIDEEWFNDWFNGKVVELNSRLEKAENEISGIKTNVTNLTNSLNAISGIVDDNVTNITKALQQIAANATKISEVETMALDAKTKAEANEKNVTTLAERLAKIKGVEYIKAGNNVEVAKDEEGYVTISANVPEFDTTEIENRLGEVEGKVVKNESDIIALQEAIKNITPEGEALSGDGVTIQTNENGFLTVRISEDELNTLRKNSNGLFVQGVEMILGDEEINNEEN